MQSQGYTKALRHLDCSRKLFGVGWGWGVGGGERYLCALALLWDEFEFNICS